MFKPHRLSLLVAAAVLATVAAVVAATAAAGVLRGPGALTP